MGVNSIAQQKDLHFKITKRKTQYSLAKSYHIFNKENLSDTLCAPNNEKDNMVSSSK